MNNYKILFCGDIVGRSGREAILKHIPLLRKELSLDFVVVNGENAAAGFGITPDICKSLYKAGVDVITTGNHIWDQKDIIPYLEQDQKLLRPLNYPPQTPGRGFTVIPLSGSNILVINLMTRLFMDPLDDPFQCIKNLLGKYILGKNVDVIILDFHGEATSEKIAMGCFLDGKVSFVVGTHTHVPTADHRILPSGTAYISDVGMCGDYNSILGMHRDAALERFTKKIPTRLKPAEGEATLCGVLVSVSRETGLASKINPLRVGGILSQSGYSRDIL